MPFRITTKNVLQFTWRRRTVDSDKEKLKGVGRWQHTWTRTDDSTEGKWEIMFFSFDYVINEMVNVAAVQPRSDYPASSGFSRPDATLRWERNHCEQPFAFSSSMRVHVMTTNIQRQDGNENFNKTIGLISKTTTFARASRFYFCISLPCLHDYDVKMPNSAFYGVRKQATTKFILLFALELGYGPLEFNSIWVRLHLTK